MTDHGPKHSASWKVGIISYNKTKFKIKNVFGSVRANYRTSTKIRWKDNNFLSTMSLLSHPTAWLSFAMSDDSPVTRRLAIVAGLAFRCPPPSFSPSICVFPLYMFRSTCVYECYISFLIRSHRRLPLYTANNVVARIVVKCIVNVCSQAYRVVVVVDSIVLSFCIPRVRRWSA